jgi:transposase-like protein
MSVPANFRKKPCDLKGATLSFEDKLWFVNQLDSQKQKCKSLSEKYNISKNRLQKWLRLFRGGKKIYGDNCRPETLRAEDKVQKVYF